MAHYPFSTFEVFIDRSPSKGRRTKIEQTSTPRAFPIKGKKSFDLLTRLINDCVAAEEGHRSERDYHLCCESIEQGWLKSDVWAAVQNKGKFAEGGERYFDLTWEQATWKTKEKILVAREAKLNEARAKKAKAAAASESGAPDTAGGSDAAYTIEKAIVSSIGIDVLGQCGRGAKVYSEFHRKIEGIQDVAHLTYELLLLIAGPPVKEKVVKVKSDGDLAPGTYTLSEVKDAIALLAGRKRIGDQTELGVGCWEGMDESGAAYQSVVVVSPGGAAEWNGTGSLTQISHPRCRGHLLDFDSGSPWFNYERLGATLAKCDTAFAQATKTEAVNLFSGWRWKENEMAPIIMAGLVFSTWVQALWEWRPQIAVIGASKTGKTYFCNALDRIFGRLCLKSSNSSAAGIRQAIKTSSRVILCDEFEESKYRTEVLEMLRVAGRGDVTLRGTANQHAQEFRLRHIVWVASIESGLKREADRNRFITLELLPPEPEKRGKLVLPSPTELGDLGQRMLAVAIKNIFRAKPLAALLKDTRVPGVDDRVIESFAVPVAMMAAIDGASDESARTLLEQMLSYVDSDDKETKSDDSKLMATILGAHIHAGRCSLSAAQLLQIVTSKKPEPVPVAQQATTGGEQTQQANGAQQTQQAKTSFRPPLATRSEARIALAKCGLKIDSCDEGSGKCLVIAYDAVSEHLLKSTTWKDQSIDQILRRIPKAKKSRRRVGGKRDYVIQIDWAEFKNEYLSDPADGRKRRQKETNSAHQDNGHAGVPPENETAEAAATSS